MVKGLAALALLAGSASADTYFSESFGEGWEDRWVVSSEKDGKWGASAGEFHADSSNLGLQTTQDAKFYGISAKMDKTFDNKDKDLVVSFTVKHEQKIDCGGAYIKLMPSIDQTTFGGDSPYSLMFGPDICGSTKRTHAIFGNYGEEGKNIESTKNIRCESDQLTHVYRMVVKPDNTYSVSIDTKEVESGSIYDNWKFLLPKEIKDPEQSKPETWVDEVKIPDPEDVKPEGYDDIPAQIPDPDAEKPDDWDDEDDGEWEAPMLDNPDFKGPWTPKMIDNPAYIGPWEHPMIPNPDFVDDANVYHTCKDCMYVGFELWQVKSGTIFDDILITDSVEEAKAWEEAHWGAIKDAEKEMFDEKENARREKERLEREAAEAKAAEQAEDEEDFDMGEEEL